MVRGEAIGLRGSRRRGPAAAFMGETPTAIPLRQIEQRELCWCVAKSRRHHCIPRLLLRAFADPPTDEGRLFVLDKQRRKRFPSSPGATGFRMDYNRVTPQTHPNPMAVEEFHAKVESMVSPTLDEVRRTAVIPGGEAAAHIPLVVALQMVRTPAHRRWLEGKLFENLEAEWGKYTRNKASRRRFATKQKKFGLPEDCWTPEGFMAVLKSGDFQVETADDDWKMAISNEALLPFAEVLARREWFVYTPNSENEPLIIGDAGVGLLAIGPGPRPVGIARADTLVFLPIAPNKALIGTLGRPAPTLRPIDLNTASYGWSLEHCYCTTDDFMIADPDRGPTPWSFYLDADSFPKLAYHAGDLADEYAGKECPDGDGDHR